MQRFVRCSASLFVSCIAVFVVGCADDGRVPTYEVNGRVQFADGSPLKGGSIICLSDSDEGLSARGAIGEDGTFALGTYEQDDGAIAGRHMVMIDPPVPQNFNPDAGPAPKVIHDRYRQHHTSGLELTVAEDEPNEVTLEVSKK